MSHLPLAVALALLLAGAAHAKPPLWDKALPAKGRFKVLGAFANEAVLDRETGLVWMRTPGTFTGSWYVQSDTCVFSEVGGRMGFRLPRAEELLSLFQDPTPGLLRLPEGHPFVGAESGLFWSSSMSSVVAGFGMVQLVVVDLTARTITTLGRSGVARAWCVRGGAGEEDFPLP